MQEIKQESLVYFYGVFQEFVVFSEGNYINSKLDDIVNSGMKIIQKLTFIKSSFLYLLNLETFELDIKYSNSNTNQELDNQKVLELLIESGTIGEALQNCKVSFYTTETFDEFLVFPLISIDGVIGVIILQSNIIVDNIRLNLISLIKLISSALANMIHGFNLREAKKRSDDMIDQAIAVRTKKLVENQQVLGERIEKMKSNLSMALPHEFRTPINQIHGFSNYLVNYFSNQQGEDYQDIIEIVGDIKDSADRLKLTFENYLYYANLFIISSNIEEIIALQHCITEYVDTVIFEYVMTVAYKHNRSEDAEIYTLESQLAIQEEHLIKIINEITDNCFKFSEPGTKVVVSTSIEHNSYKICFMDYGIGLKTDDIENIDAYIQFERMRNEQQGLGLGLSIVRKILDLYQGEIVLESEPFKFTKVIVSIPIAN